MARHQDLQLLPCHYESSVTHLSLVLNTLLHDSSFACHSISSLNAYWVLTSMTRVSSRGWEMFVLTHKFFVNVSVSCQGSQLLGFPTVQVYDVSPSILALEKPSGVSFSQQLKSFATFCNSFIDNGWIISSWSELSSSDKFASEGPAWKGPVYYRQTQGDQIF